MLELKNTHPNQELWNGSENEIKCKKDETTAILCQAVNLVENLAKYYTVTEKIKSFC